MPLLLVAMPGATSSILAPSSDALVPSKQKEELFREVTNIEGCHCRKRSVLRHSCRFRSVAKAAGGAFVSSRMLQVVLGVPSQ